MALMTYYIHQNMRKLSLSKLFMCVYCIIYILLSTLKVMISEYFKFLFLSMVFVGCIYLKHEKKHSNGFGLLNISIQWKLLNIHLERFIQKTFGIRISNKSIFRLEY